MNNYQIPLFLLLVKSLGPSWAPSFTVFINSFTPYVILTNLFNFLSIVFLLFKVYKAYVGYSAIFKLCAFIIHFWSVTSIALSLLLG